jgi:hypothetical protein
VGLIAWNPLLSNGPLGAILGATEVVIGSFIELATIVYFRSVFYNGKKGYSIKNLGFYEYAAGFTAIWSMVTHGFGIYALLSLTTANGRPVVDLSTSLVFSFFSMQIHPLFGLNLSSVCLWLILSKKLRILGQIVILLRAFKILGLLVKYDLSTLK